MSTVVSEIESNEPAPKKSFVERFVGVFFSPGSTFADIVRNPDFIAPLIVAVIGTLGVTEVMLAKVGIERIVRQQIEHSSRASSMTPEQMQQAVEQGAKFGSIISHVSGVLGAPIVLLILGGLGLLIMNVIFGAQLKFRTAFAVVCYANLVSIVGVLIAVAMILFGDLEHFNPQNLMPTNPGFFLNPLETSKPLMALLSSLDIFTFWLMALLGIGFSAASGGKVKSLTVFLCFLGLLAVWVLAKVGLSMLG